MSPETINAIKGALTPLAQKLNESAEFVFKAYITHAYALGIALIMGGALTILAAIGVAIGVWRKWDDLDFMQVLGPMLATIGLVVGASMLGGGIMHLIAPQYYAIHDILCTVKNCAQ